MRVLLGARSDNGLHRLLESLSPPAFGGLLESTTWMFGHVDMSGCPDMFGYVWICLDMSGYLDSLDMSGHICFNSGLRVVLTRFNSGLRVVLTQGVLTACQR